MRDPRRLTGMLLIAGGLLWALVATTDLDATLVVPGVGLAFIAAYLVTRQYGLLIPGGILTGLGVGLVVAAQGGPDEAVVLGLGLGFVAIPVIDGRLGDGDAAWWPLIPGGILTVVGVSRITGIRDIGIYLVPAALILIGVVVLVRPSRDRRDPAPGSATSPSGDVTDPSAAGELGDERR
jgi:hypothetical protein